MNIWFYRDRTGVPRGPMTINTVKKAYVNGIVDQHTLFWGNGLGDWVPLRNIRGMARCLSDPKTRFVKFLVDKFVFPKKERAENRNALYDEGLAKSPTFNKDQAAKWRKNREEALVSGEETTMLSLGLAMPRSAKLGKKVKGFFAEKFGKKEKKKEGGVRIV
tara:strand:- start:3124 stop:3609 length:486 start_codon:yes stop_codon:yes gene_type:complete